VAFLTDLASIARSAGLTVREVSGWQTRAIYGDDTLTEVRGVMWHHTATDAQRVVDENNPTLNYMVDGLGYPLCNLALAWDGSVDVVAAGAAAHAGEGVYSPVERDLGNWQTIGIEAEGTTGLVWSSAQLESAARLGHALSEAYGSNILHIGHYEYAPGRKVDPSGVPGDMPALRAAIERGYWSTPDREGGDAGLPDNNPGHNGRPVVSHRWTSTPHQTAAIKLIGGVEAARNRAFNGNFGAGNLGWASNSRVEEVEVVPRDGMFPWLDSGENMARFRTSSGTGYIYHSSGYRVDTIPGKWYGVKVSIKVPAGVRGRLQVQFRDSGSSTVKSSGHTENNPPAEGMEYEVVAQAPEGSDQLWAFVWPRDDITDWVYAAGMIIAEGDTEQEARDQIHQHFDGDSPGHYASDVELGLRAEPRYLEFPYEAPGSGDIPIFGFMRAIESSSHPKIQDDNSSSGNTIADLLPGARVFTLYRPSSSNYFRVAWGDQLGWMARFHLTRHEREAEKTQLGPWPRSAIGDGRSVWPDGPLAAGDGWHTTDSHNAWALFLSQYHDTEDFGINLQLFLRDQSTYRWPYAIDGDLGAASVLALQQFLANEGYLPNDPLWVDGIRGAGTIRAEKEFLNDQRGNYAGPY
jgi:hypothetical protein